jgi:DNA-binding NtrC family response regulator
VPCGNSAFKLSFLSGGREEASLASILLVEDDEHVRKPLEMLLAFERYDVTAAENAAKAAFLLGWKPFDLLLTDVSLPDGNGLEIADKAKEMGMPALVVTGYALGLEPCSLDGYDYLLKPIRERELLAVVRQRLHWASNVMPFPRRSTRN